MVKCITTKIKDPVSALTHFFGFLASIPILITLVTIASRQNGLAARLSMAIFGVSLLLLYGASTIYHTLMLSPENTIALKRIDHMMIFILIAGTYTPICVVTLGGVWGYTLLGLVWFCAVAGICLKAFWLGAPRWFSTALYVIMGWLVVIAFVPLKQALPTTGIGLLVAGGVTYTLGAVIYAVKWPKFHFKYFGFHELFHLFVLGGSAFHIAFMYQYVL